jgi:hypothetical protein
VANKKAKTPPAQQPSTQVIMVQATLGSVPSTVAGDPPWPVGSSSSGTPPIQSMAYQIGNSFPRAFPPIMPVPTPDPYNPWSFSLTADDLPTLGTYLLTIYWWDTAGNGFMQSLNLTRNP